MRNLRLAAVVLLVGACRPLPPRAADEAVARAGEPLMGTVFQVTVVAADREQADQLARAAVAEGRHWDDVLTTWRAEGELARLNARAGAAPVEVSEDLGTALGRMRELSAATGGTFDPGVGGLVDLWRRPAPPSGAEIERLGPWRIGAALELSGRYAALRRSAALDAGGIGKGMALDAAAERLRRGGVRSAFLDFGGSSQLAVGAPPGEAGWRVAVAGLGEGVVHGVVALRDASLSTSRASGPGEAAGPIVDPRAGRPVAAPRLATVLAADAATADAWSTALVVLGRAGFEAVERAGLGALFEDAAGPVRTQGFPLPGVPLWR